ncbi:hypothetical protein [Amycolatopsis sp. NPDC051716]|jgi:hypothetical protein|uniref:hypothetical protein n=1 Tax=Amycolatopsis sp. NPDC051716 TaxID=3155804 RepID=UPI003431371D
MSELIRRTGSSPARTGKSLAAKAAELVADAEQKVATAKQGARVALSIAELRAEAEMVQDRRDRGHW